MLWQRPTDRRTAFADAEPIEQSLAVLRRALKASLIHDAAAIPTEWNEANAMLTDNLAAEALKRNPDDKTAREIRWYIEIQVVQALQRRLEEAEVQTH